MTTQPTQTSVLESLEECRRLGDKAFLEKYASGHQPLGHYLIHEDKRYPMKAVWAAAHRPTIQTRDFKTGAARRGLKALGFTKFCPRKIQDEAVKSTKRWLYQGAKFSLILILAPPYRLRRAHGVAVRENQRKRCHGKAKDQTKEKGSDVKNVRRHAKDDQRQRGRNDALL